MPYSQSALAEAGCDEAGRGCLAGPVFAAAVILPKDFKQEQLNDSKKLPPKLRFELRKIIEREALAYSVASVDNKKIDEINILNASLLAMHRALEALREPFGLILVDGNRFKPFRNIPHRTIVGGDGKYMSIAAASILAKTYRDEFMEQLHADYPLYGWNQNKGYATAAHRKAVYAYGPTPFHRKSFVLKGKQGRLMGF